MRTMRSFSRMFSFFLSMAAAAWHLCQSWIHKPKARIGIFITGLHHQSSQPISSYQHRKNAYDSNDPIKHPSSLFSSRNHPLRHAESPAQVVSISEDQLMTVENSTAIRSLWTV
ncbi:hypothetical protein FB446DRAFT_735272, partial [Lentinula raphanica]